MALFGRDTPKPTGDSVPAFEPRPRGAESEPKRGNTVIGPQAVFNGEISGDEDVLVEGKVDGSIRLQRQLTIGAGGQVQADIHAKSVLIAGKVVGDVSADERVELLATGSLEGNIRAAKIVIAEGAHFKGSVDMAASKPPRREEVSEDRRSAAMAPPPRIEPPLRAGARPKNG